MNRNYPGTVRSTHAHHPDPSRRHRERRGVSGLIFKSIYFTPLIWLAVGLLLLEVALLVRAWWGTIRTNYGCRDCGYDLTGIPGDASRCPECGGDLAVCALTGSVVVRRRLRSRGIRCLAVILLAGVGLMLVQPWRLPYTPTWVLTNIDLPVVRWRGRMLTPDHTHGLVWRELKSRLIRDGPSIKTVIDDRGNYELQTPKDFIGAPALTKSEMKILLEGVFEQLAEEGIADVDTQIRHPIGLWEAAMRAGWWTPEEVGAVIGKIPPIQALSLTSFRAQELLLVLDSPRLSSGFVPMEVQFSDLELDIDDRTLRLVELPNDRGASQSPTRRVFGHHDLDVTPGQSTIFTKNTLESKVMLRYRLVLVSSGGTPLASQWVAGPVDRDFDVSATRMVLVATGDAVDAIGGDLSEASVFIPDPEGGKGGRIVIATTNADWAEAPRRDGQALDLVYRVRPHTSRISTDERFVTESSTRELPPLPDGRRRFTLREFEYEDVKALGPGTVRFGLDSMTWHDILAASEDTDPDWDPRRESRLIPFTVSIPSAAPIVTSAPDETP